MSNLLRKKRIQFIGGPFKCYKCGNALRNEDLDFNVSEIPELKCSKCKSLTILDPQHFKVLSFGGILNKYREWILGILGLVIAVIISLV